ncbi:hypothetical protein H8N03_20065 [Ramlibacter sp. USB13]|uniref:Uncharacterized protein n=1 Tax=Ramlibacter cellulosilyticus TaxID=2764187 RepID=A0A923MV30_9BURK|nr:hypothetical protein [Ramlibacter cellulosilyticus]MBC5785253.1 hypothetical protein [Ramlibacter cellulosilyticus]
MLQPTPAATTRTISIASAYGEIVASEQVPASEFHAALRRFYNRAVHYANSVVVLDGVTQSRNSFLEFVRHFNDSAERAARLQHS